MKGGPLLAVGALGVGAVAFVLSGLGKSTGQAISSALQSKGSAAGGDSTAGGKHLVDPGHIAITGKGAGLPDTFWTKLLAVASELASTAEAMANVLMSESGLNPKAKNSIGCVGLNQFCGSTFANVVLSKTSAQWQAMSASERDAEIEKYRALPAELQLDYVALFWSKKPKSAMGTARDLYWVNFLPATYVAGADDSHVLTKSATIIKANPVFSSDGGETIRAGDLARVLAKVASTREFQAVLSQIDRARNNLGVS